MKKDNSTSLENIRKISLTMDNLLFSKEIYTIRFRKSEETAGSYAEIGRDLSGDDVHEKILIYRNDLTEKLDSFHILEWKEEYYPDRPILDGYAWDLQIEFEGGETFSSHGMNAEPDSLSDLTRFLKRILQQDGLGKIRKLEDRYLMMKISDLYHQNPDIQFLMKTDLTSWLEDHGDDRENHRLLFATALDELKKRKLTYLPSLRETDLQWQLNNNRPNRIRICFQDQNQRKDIELALLEDGKLRIQRNIGPFFDRNHLDIVCTDFGLSEYLQSIPLRYWKPFARKPRFDEDWTVRIGFEGNPQLFNWSDKGTIPLPISKVIENLSIQTDYLIEQETIRK